MYQRRNLPLWGNTRTHGILQPSTLNPPQGYKKNLAFYQEPSLCPVRLGAVHTIPGNGDKMRVFLVERSILENALDVLLNPRL
jgi:hypothetical protein